MATCCRCSIRSRWLRCGRATRYECNARMSMQSAIRCFLQNSDSVITCGEDASVCIWSASAAEKSGRSGGEERKRLPKTKGGRSAYQSL